MLVSRRSLPHFEPDCRNTVQGLSETCLSMIGICEILGLLNEALQSSPSLDRSKFLLKKADEGCSCTLCCRVEQHRTRRFVDKVEQRLGACTVSSRAGIK